MGNIGEIIKEIELEPIPDDIPVEEPSPVLEPEPDKVLVPA